MFWVMLVAVAAIVAAVHGPVLDSRALCADDDVFVTNNRLVMHPGWESARTFFAEVTKPSSVPGYYLPVSMTSLMLDAARGGRTDQPRAFHETALALHVAVTLLIALLVYRLFGAVVPAGLAALAFGLHPLTVEPVAWISERKTLLSTLFGLASVLAYLESVRRESRTWRAASLAAFAMALMSKPSVTTLPLLLLLLDHWPLRRLRLATVVEKWPYFALAAISAIVAATSLRNTDTFVGAPPSAFGALLRMLYLPAFYLGKTLAPVDLSCVYSPPEPFTLANPPVLAGVALTCAMTAALFALRKRLPGVWVGWLFMLFALAPTFGIIRWSHLIAWDRYFYLPAGGLALALGWGLAVLWSHPSRARHLVVAGVAALMLAAEVRGTRAALGPWRDTVTLWRNAVTKAPNEPMAHNGLGAAIGRDSLASDEAMREFRRSIELNPDFVAGLGNVAASLIDAGRLDEANPYLRRAETLVPTSPDIAYQLGWAAHEGGKLDSAAIHYERALRLQPAHIEARVELGIVQVQQGRIDDGVGNLRRAAALSPTHPGAELSLAMGLLKQGGHDAEAIARLREAVRLKRDWQAPLNTLAWLLATHPDPQLRNGAEAAELAARVVELTGGSVPAALDTQAAAEAAAGRFDRARQIAAHAIELATAAHQDSLALQIRSRLAKYDHGEPYTEPVRANF